MALTDLGKKVLSLLFAEKRGKPTCGASKDSCSYICGQPVDAMAATAHVGKYRKHSA